MEIRYKRDPNVSHMIIDNVEEYSSFEDRMIAENDIPCLLKYAKSGTNGNCSYWYDISARKSLKAYFLQEGINQESIYTCFKGMSDALSTIGKYLLNAGSIVIKPETVFFRNDGISWKTYFAYVPGMEEDFARGFSSIAEFLISNVDHDDKKTVSYCYNIFEKVNKGDFTLGELMELSKLSYPVEESFSGNFELEGEDDFKKIEEETDKNQDLGRISLPLGSPENIFGKLDDMFEEPKKPKKQNKPFFSFNKSDAKIIRSKKPTHKKDQAAGFFKKKKEELLGAPADFEDFIMDPTDNESSSSFVTTVLIGKEMDFRRRLIYEGRGEYPDLDIYKTPFMIGSRENGNDGVIKEGIISRTHAKITIIEDEYYIEDMESRNGTFLNGQILNFGKVAKLSPGDRISFANIGYRFQ